MRADTRWRQRAEDIAGGLEQHAAGWQTLSRLLAVGGAGLIGFRLTITSGLTPGFALAMAALPLWIPVVLRTRGALVLLITGVAAIGSGLLLTEVASADHATQSNLALQNSVLMTSMLCSMGFLLWARQFVSVAALGAALGTGMLVQAVLIGTASDNPW